MIKKRVERIQQELAAGQAFLVTSETNRFYFTGFQSSDGAVFIARDGAVFLIDFRYIEKARQVVTSCEVQLNQRTNEELAALCARFGITELFVEAGYTSVSRFGSLQEALPDVAVQNSDRFDRITTDMRSIKTAAELALIREAQRMTDETFTYILNRIESGRSERDIMLDMEFYMRRLGSEGVSFDFIVVSGKNSSLPHGVPTEKKVERGDFVTMDFGAVVGGYRSDMTRTVAVGEASEDMRRVYDTVLGAQLESIRAVRPGAVCSDIDKIARDLIYGAGYEGCFGHGLGHSVGVEVHEAPSFSPRCDTVLLPGMVMTVEPGIYLENRFGVRIEDMVYVTEDDRVDITASDKQLIVV